MIFKYRVVSFFIVQITHQFQSIWIYIQLLSIIKRFKSATI